MSEKPRPPSEVSAALPADVAADLRDERDHLAATCDRLTRELSEAQEATAAKTCAVNAALDVLKVERERAEKAERELSEARAALEKAQFLRAEEHKTRRWNVHATPDGIAICEGDHSSGVSCDEIEYVRKHRLRAAESSCREHAEAIVALRALLDEFDRYQHGQAEYHGSPFEARVKEAIGGGGNMTARALADLAFEIVEFITEEGGIVGARERERTIGWVAARIADFEKSLASRLSAEREKERAVVRAAREYRQLVKKPPEGWFRGKFLADAADKLDASLAALPASPSDKEDT
jgi:hypothetical protein